MVLHYETRGLRRKASVPLGLCFLLSFFLRPLLTLIWKKIILAYCCYYYTAASIAGVTPAPTQSVRLTCLGSSPCVVRMNKFTAAIKISKAKSGKKNN